MDGQLRRYIEVRQEKIVVQYKQNEWTINRQHTKMEAQNTTWLCMKLLTNKSTLKGRGLT